MATVNIADYVLSHIRFGVYKLSKLVQTGSNWFSEILCSCRLPLSKRVMNSGHSSQVHLSQVSLTPGDFLSADEVESHVQARTGKMTDGRSNSSTDIQGSASNSLFTSEHIFLKSAARSSEAASLRGLADFPGMLKVNQSLRMCPRLSLSWKS